MAQVEARTSRQSSNQAEARGSTRVANRIVRALAEAGIDRTFGIPGGTISPVVDALLDSGIEHVTCQHESMAVYMAAGYARATGKPAVVVVTSGPGVLNTMTGLAAAYQDEVPVLVLAGDVARGERRARSAPRRLGPGDRRRAHGRVDHQGRGEPRPAGAR